MTGISSITNLVSSVSPPWLDYIMNSNAAGATDGTKGGPTRRHAPSTDGEGEAREKVTPRCITP